jgi:hypothetical protein
LTVKFDTCRVLPCGYPQGQNLLWVKTIHMCSYSGPGEDYHDDFDKNLDWPCGGWSDVGWITQYKGWTSSAYGKEVKTITKIQISSALSPQLPALPIQHPFVGHRQPIYHDHRAFHLEAV